MRLSILKDWIKLLSRSFPLPLSRNHAYDLLTKKIIKSICKPDSNCIDVGCHKGEIMDIILQYAPHGHHIGFEPIPKYFEKLKLKYRNHPHVKISNIALSDQKAKSNFNYVITNPAYSGIKKRNYDRVEKDTTIEVDLDILDHFTIDHPRIDLIKIDVEGAELQVLRGAQSCIRRDLPVIIFEHGKGASDIYNTYPNDIFDFFHSLNYGIYSLQSYLTNDRKAYDKSAFKDEYDTGRNYYFVADRRSGDSHSSLGK